MLESMEWWERKTGGPLCERVDFWMEDEGVHMQVVVGEMNFFSYLFVILSKGWGCRLKY
jgi:hypothetical protein